MTFDARALDERWQRNFDAHLRRTQLKELAIVHLGGKCQKCGYDTCLAALDFHHLDDADKDFDISSRQSWAAIEAELKKCVLLCSNCHRETHAGLHPDLLTLEEPSHGYLGELDWGDDDDTDPCSFVGRL